MKTQRDIVTIKQKIFFSKKWPISKNGTAIIDSAGPKIEYCLSSTPLLNPKFDQSIGLGTANSFRNDNNSVVRNTISLSGDLIPP